MPIGPWNLSGDPNYWAPSQPLAFPSGYQESVINHYKGIIEELKESLKWKENDHKSAMS